MPDLKKNNAGAKVVMVFGAGVNQLELIESSRRLGIISVVLDPCSDPPGKYSADFFYQVQGDDFITTREIALKHKVNGIVTGQMEKPLRLMAHLADELGYCFHSSGVIEGCLDKWLMKESFKRHSVPCAKALLIGSGFLPIDTIIADIGFPCIIKPRDAFSSRGVYKIDTVDELRLNINETISYSSNGDILVEEFLDGREFSVEAITWHGITTIIQYTQKFITPYPNTVEMAHLQPASISEKEKKEIEDVVCAGINALKIDNSASHTEVMLTKNGSKIIEIGARTGGDFISSYLTKASTGVSMDEAVIRMALHQSPDLTKKKHKYAMIKYLQFPEGKVVRNILSFYDLLDLPGLIFVHVFVKPGEFISPIRHSAMRPACVLVEADNEFDVSYRVEKAAALLTERIILE